MKKSRKKEIIKKMKNDLWREESLEDFADLLRMVADYTELQLEIGQKDFVEIRVDVSDVLKIKLNIFNCETEFNQDEDRREMEELD